MTPEWIVAADSRSVGELSAASASDAVCAATQVPIASALVTASIDTKRSFMTQTPPTLYNSYKLAGLRALVNVLSVAE
ncbi:hypothetical protein [Novosphingobium sp.]|uniref:hypothetical protein n=1 Tax=Novosphingobium sp. TaxID=1874826 RepID=UPI0025DBBEDA|nr:hypothetical protein [Novosphingobium sp.]